MVAISLSGSGEGPGWVTAPGYSTAAFSGSPVSKPTVQLEPRPYGGLLPDTLQAEGL